MGKMNVGAAALWLVGVASGFRLGRTSAGMLPGQWQPPWPTGMEKWTALACGSLGGLSFGRYGRTRSMPWCPMRQGRWPLARGARGLWSDIRVENWK